MADEKKFLEETIEVPSNKRLLSKNIILGFVVFVVLLLCVLAWFTSKSEANADGVSVIARGDDGLQVAITQHSYNSETDTHSNAWTDFADKWTYHSSFTSANPLPLISGNGLNLFEPSYVKVRDNDNLYEYLDLDELESNGLDVSWADVTDKLNSSTGEKSSFIEYKMKFRNANPCNVFLNKNSTVDPLNVNENKNQWDFSRDYIAATSRVAFLKESGNSLSLHSLWIPNETMELTHQDQSSTTTYSYEEKTPQGTVNETTTTTGGDGIPTGGNHSGLYLWWSSTNTITNGNAGQMVAYYDSMQSYELMERDDDYYVMLTTPPNIPSDGRDLPLFITTSDEIVLRSTGGTQYEVSNSFDLSGRGISSTYGVFGTNGVTFNADSFNLCMNSSTGAYVIGTGKISVWHGCSNSPMSFYLIISKNSDSSGTVTGIVGVTGDIEEVTTYSVDIVDDGTVYVPQNDDILMITASNSGNNYPLSSTNGTAGSSVDKPPGNISSPVWRVAGVEDEGSFKLIDALTSKYLSISNGNSLTASDTSEDATAFYAVTKYKVNSSDPVDLNGVILYSYRDNAFIIYNGTSFVVSSTYTTTYTHHIYLQTETSSVTYGSWGIVPNGETESPFRYKTYNSGTNKYVTNTLASSEYFLTRDMSQTPSYKSAATTADYKNFICTLGGTPDSEGYYTSEEITVRIWAEGYDREAQTPVEGGRMKINFNFFAVEQKP